MVNIDTVYQRVLALANKEQRGYITPQEFNLFANQAQMDIFEQYFYDRAQFGRIPGNKTMYADPVDILEEKIEIFQLAESLGSVESLVCVPFFMTHAALPDKIKLEMGITETLIRLSVGIEDLDDLKLDLSNALNK